MEFSYSVVCRDGAYIYIKEVKKMASQDGFITAKR
jgi:hypothetical protein